MMGVGGRRSGSSNIFKVVSVPGANASPSRACRPNETSGAFSSFGEIVTLLTMPSPLSDGDVLNTLDGLSEKHLPTGLS